MYLNPPAQARKGAAQHLQKTKPSRRGRAGVSKPSGPSMQRSHSSAVQLDKCPGPSRPAPQHLAMAPKTPAAKGAAAKGAAAKDTAKDPAAEEPAAKGAEAKGAAAKDTAALLAVGNHAEAAVVAAAAAAVGAKSLPSWEELTNPRDEEATAKTHSITCEEYVSELEPSVRERLGKFLSVRGELHEQEPLAIDKENANGLQTFKEQWRKENCKTSLVQHFLYEAPGNAFRLSLRPPTWAGKALPAAQLTCPARRREVNVER